MNSDGELVPVSPRKHALEGDGEKEEEEDCQSPTKKRKSPLSFTAAAVDEAVTAAVEAIAADEAVVEDFMDGARAVLLAKDKAD